MYEMVAMRCSGDGAEREMQRSCACFRPASSGRKTVLRMTNLLVWGAPSATLAPLILEIGLDPLLDAHAALVLDVEANAESLVRLAPADLCTHPDARQSQQGERNLDVHADRDLLGALDRHPARADLLAGGRKAPVVGDNRNFGNDRNADIAAKF